MSSITESVVEQAALDWLAAVGYTTGAGPTYGPDGSAPERVSYSEVLLLGRLQAALIRLNPQLPPAAQEAALRVLQSTIYPTLIDENRRLHQLLVDGVPVEVLRPDGTLAGDRARLIDFADPANNDWLALNQFTVIESVPGAGAGPSALDSANRRPDVVLFVNGLPLAVLELKHPGSETATLAAAYQQLQTYKAQIPSLFRTNAILVTSDGLQARLGSLTADSERFMPWRTLAGPDLAPPGLPELQVLLQGVFAPRRFLDLLHDFIVFGQIETPDHQIHTIKILAGYHQFHAVQQAVDRTLLATQPAGDRKIGVIWHTQGSGKSLLMAFYAGRLITHPALANPTLIILTDRNDLDDQLFSTFTMCQALLRQPPQQADNREDLRRLLDRAAGGVIFTTIQKFRPDSSADRLTHPLLTDRRNVIIIADEAHRSQYGFEAKVDAATAKVSYGFAKYVRDALPNASFIGFTGTPIEHDDVNTPAVFGTYIDVYDISRAVTDGATVPIYYESRLARIELSAAERPQLDAEMATITEDAVASEQERLQRKWASLEALVGADTRLALVAADLVAHFERRQEALAGKGLIVCMSRRICVALYAALVQLRPAWHSADDTQGVLKVVMSGAATDPATWQPHIGKQPQSRRDLLAKRFKDPHDSLQLVIVRDMWLTGFDVPSLHTMYIDKPMYGHSLMQAIARVNRVFRNKPAGLIVDYIGIGQDLKAALGEYSAPDQSRTGLDMAAAVALLQEKYEIVRALFAPDTPGGFDYHPALDPAVPATTRMTLMAGALDWLLGLQQRAVAQESTAAGRKQALRRYDDLVLALSQAFALAAASDTARLLRDEVGFFQALRAALVKSVPTGRGSGPDREFAIQQLISRAVVSTEIVDIMHAAGIRSPDLSIFSDEFLAEVRNLEHKNLALDALRRLLQGAVHAQSSRNVIQARAFSERLDAAIARYHANALSTVQVLEELIQLAQDIRAARTRGEESGLSLEEIAFYDALADNASAVQVLGDPQLRLIAHELVTSLRRNTPVDWIHRESARAQMRLLVKRILRHYGYPPDLQDAAVQNVLQQAEALAVIWAA